MMSSSTDQRLLREKSYHDSRFGKHDPRSAAKKFYFTDFLHVGQYEKLINSLLFPGTRLLEYGCGKGNNCSKWSKRSTHIHGIDISPKSIEQARKTAQQENCDIAFSVMNAESLEFEDNSFDIIVGSGILHHLDLDKALGEMSRVLKSNGDAIFIEPLAHNPMLNLYRHLTPKMRTPDEHPIRMQDIALMRDRFEQVQSYHYHLLTHLAYPLRGRSAFAGTTRILNAVDQAFFAMIPFIRRYSWLVVLHLKRPLGNLADRNGRGMHEQAKKYSLK